MIRNYYGVIPLVALLFICLGNNDYTGKTTKGHTTALINFHAAKDPAEHRNDLLHLLPLTLKQPIPKSSKTDNGHTHPEYIIHHVENKILLTGIFTIVAITICIYFFMRNKFREKRLLGLYEIETRISKKVHDEIANEIYNTLCFANSEDISIQKNKDILLKSLDKVYSKTRNISREMSGIDTGAGYDEQLRLLLSGYQNQNVNIIIKGIDSINWSKIATTKKIAAYRALQEVMVNMKKHSSASVVVIDFRQKNKKIIIRYSDNGVGINSGKNITRNGLLNVENRMDSINGKVIFEPTADRGFHLTLSYPV
jgi:signal transduction histidine kinase